MKTVKVGDKVWWRGSFGMARSEVATITTIEHTEGQKYGYSVKMANWDNMIGREYTVDLDNGSWAYAEQLSYYEGE